MAELLTTESQLTLTGRIRTQKGGARLSDEEYNRRWFERLRARTVVNEKGCHVWQGPVTVKGYIMHTHRAYRTQGHRISYMLKHGVRLRKDQLVCHDCDNRRCWNDDHHWIGSPAQNSLDMVKKGRCHEWTRTHCPKNHPYDETNTTWKVAKSGRPARECRECVRMRSKLRYHRRKAAQMGAAT